MIGDAVQGMVQRHTQVAGILTDIFGVSYFLLKGQGMSLGIWMSRPAPSVKLCNIHGTVPQTTVQLDLPPALQDLPTTLHRQNVVVCSCERGVFAIPFSSFAVPSLSRPSSNFFFRLCFVLLVSCLWQGLRKVSHRMSSLVQFIFAPSTKTKRRRAQIFFFTILSPLSPA